MKKNHFTLFAVVTVALCAAAATGTGCGGNKTTTTSSSSSSGAGGASTASSSSSGTGGVGGVSATSSSSSSSGSDGGIPAPPAIGTQIDRIGRPAVNTALNNGFDADAGAAGTAKDLYNQDSTPSDWKTNWATQFEANLGIIDSLDTVCGNQLGYALTNSYAGLAGALTDDRLYLNTAPVDGGALTCTQYLAVEANALNIVPNADCGGRALPYVVMDTTYSVLAIGMLTGVSNGITANNVPFLTSFPYEAAPN